MQTKLWLKMEHLLYLKNIASKHNTGGICISNQNATG